MKTILKVVLFMGVIVMIVFGFQSAQSYSQEEDLERIQETISSLCLKCYSIEGKYPQDIYYLKKHYGLLVNENEYQIIYHYEGSNLQPTLKVYQKETKL